MGKIATVYDKKTTGTGTIIKLLVGLVELNDLACAF